VRLGRWGLATRLGQRGRLVGPESTLRRGLGSHQPAVSEGRAPGYGSLPYPAARPAWATLLTQILLRICPNTGTGFSVLFQPTSFYNLTLSCNGTVYSTMADLTTTTSANLTGLPFGTHSLEAVFQSRDTTRQLSREGVARITGIEVHREGSDQRFLSLCQYALADALPPPPSSSVEVSALDDSAWQTGEIALSAGWSLMSTSNPSANILNETQAALLMPLLSSAVNNSLAWTSTVGATLGFNFSGTDLAVYAPLSPMVGAFEPFIDGASLGIVRAGANIDADDDITGGQLLWFASGLADGPHRFEMRNVGEGGDGVMLVDSFRAATVQTQCADLYLDLSCMALGADTHPWP